MIIKTEDTYLRVKVVYSMSIETETKSIVVEPGGWFKPAVKEDKTTYVLKMKYLCEDDREYTMTWNCPTKDPLQKTMEDIWTQIKKQDNSMVDEAFEEALNNS